MVVSTRPQWFQSRYVPKGEDHDPEKAAEIVRTFDPQRFETLWVARDPRKSGNYIVIAGHHRLVAGQALKLKRVPVRVLRGNPSIPAERARLAHLVGLSNHEVSFLGLTEQVGAVRRIALENHRIRKIADTIRRRPSQTERRLDLTHLNPDLVPQNERQAKLQPVAEAVEEGWREGWVDVEAGNFPYSRVRDELEDGRKPRRRR